MSCHHFTIVEHESILIYRTQDLTPPQITKLFHLI
ncbi:helix-turn-helix domain-containing protein [Streptococcus gordonii]|nr:helix-turn-helix domain-containing protein [Streptococcus gordonii]